MCQGNSKLFIISKYYRNLFSIIWNLDVCKKDKKNIQWFGIWKGDCSLALYCAILMINYTWVPVVSLLEAILP